MTNIPPARAAVFLDKDGTLVEDVPYSVDPSSMRLTDGAGEACRLLCDAGFALIVVSNQSGVARGFFTEEALDAVQSGLRRLLSHHGAVLTDFLYCPHHPDGVVPAYRRRCSCRKPEPGMLLEAATKHGVDLARSWMVGDILDDVEAGSRAGCRTVFIDNGNETEWVEDARRFPDFTVTSLGRAATVIANTSTPVAEVAG